MTTTKIPTDATKASKNARTHGFYATEVVLPWENKQEFDDLLRNYRDEYCPEGVSEDGLVEELAILHWKKRRLEIGVQRALQQLNFDLSADISDELIELLRTALKAQTGPVQLAFDSLAKRGKRIDKAPPATSASLRVEFGLLTAELEKFNVEHRVLVSSLRAAEEHNAHDIEQACLPDILEKELRIQAEIDRRYEKLLKRLAMIKAYKELCVTKSANAKQIEAPPAKPPLDSNRS